MTNLSKLPQNLEAEVNVLGSVLIDNNVLTETIDFLKTEDFYSSVNKIIYKTMVSMYMKDIPIDTTTIINELGREKLKSVGGAIYILKLRESVPSVVNAKSYAEIVKKMSDRRVIIKSCREAINAAYKEEPSKIIGSLESSFLNLGNKGSAKILTDSKLMELTVNKIEKNYNSGGEVPGISTGYSTLDSVTNGLSRGDLIVVAGRPSMGKTSFSLNLARGISKSSKVGIFELEMSAEKLGMRRLSAETFIDSKKLSRGKMQENDWQNIIKKASEIASRNNIFTDDSSGLTIEDIKAKSKKLKLKYGLDVIIIDHLQLIETLERRQQRTQEISEITRQAKKIAKELDIAVIMLSQLSRASEQRQDHRPMLSDLRDSGSIEQDADIVMFLYRDEYYNEKSENKGIMECIIAKQRDGCTGVLKFHYKNQYQRLEEIC